MLTSRLQWLSLLILLVPCASKAAAQPGQRRSAARYGWLDSYRQGLEQARKSGKPLMLVFRCVP